MNTNLFSRWLPAITETSVYRKITDFAVRRNITPQKAVLGVAGLAFVGGSIAAPVATAQSGPGDGSDRRGLVTVQADRLDPDKLIPHGVQGEQASIQLDDEQSENARAIVKATKEAGMDARAAVIAVGTSLQESKLENLGHLGDRNDHDSLGLFQQRPSTGWGSPDQVTDPDYSTKAFLKGLRQIDGWEHLPLTEAAQRVQVSAYPYAYAQWERQAADVVGHLWNR